MTRIIAAVDDSAAARPVLRTAKAMAPVFGAAVEAVNVADAPGHTTRAAAEAAGTPLRTVPGEPIEQLCRIAEDADVAAVVMGTRDRPSGARPAGHLSLALASAMPKPVVVVPPDADVPPRIGRVLIALAGTPRSRRRLQRAVELAAAADLELVVVHVDDEDSIPMFSDQVQYDTELYATEFLARYAPGTASATFEMRVGVPADEILKAVDDVGADMLAIGWPQGDDPARGDVARDVVDRSQVPVLLVALAQEATETPPGP